ncbi:hypothetical protein ACFXPV_38970 [Streptomyces sp. NPDC059118]|uniref:effector-associated constant component EACC1 n=1 Tax=unclassified Streptomyces TaxID=2593676 RepID=UPI0036D10DFF
MNVQVRLVDGDAVDVAALWQWLNDERDLRGRVVRTSATVGATELGGVADLLTVAVGAGGSGTVLATSLIAWIRTRRTTATVTVEANGRRVTLDIATVDDISPLLHELVARTADTADAVDEN